MPAGIDRLIFFRCSETSWPAQAEQGSLISLPPPPAGRTNGFLLQTAKNRLHNLDMAAGTLASRALDYLTARLGSCAFAALANALEFEGYFFLDAENGLFEIKLQNYLYVPTDRRRTGAAGMAEETVKDVAEAAVAEIEAEALGPVEAGAGTAADAGAAELIVALSLLGIAQNPVGFVDFLELRLIAALVGGA